MSFEVHILTPNIGALSNATRPLFQAPTDAHGGGITILEASAMMGGSANSNLELVTMDSTPSAVNGTISAALGGTALWATNTVLDFTISDGFVDAEEWVAIRENNFGAANAVSIISIKYVMGK